MSRQKKTLNRTHSIYLDWHFDEFLKRGKKEQRVASKFISIVANKYATNDATEIDNNTNAPGMRVVGGGGKAD